MFTLHTSNTACDWLWRPPLTHGPVVQLHLERGQTVGVCVSLWLCVCVLILWPSDLLPVAWSLPSYTLTVYNTTANRMNILHTENFISLKVTLNIKYHTHTHISHSNSPRHRQDHQFFLWLSLLGHNNRAGLKGFLYDLWPMAVLWCSVRLIPCAEQHGLIIHQHSAIYCKMTPSAALRHILHQNRAVKMWIWNQKKQTIMHYLQKCTWNGTCHIMQHMYCTFLFFVIYHGIHTGTCVSFYHGDGYMPKSVHTYVHVSTMFRSVLPLTPGRLSLYIWPCVLHPPCVCSCVLML